MIDGVLEIESTECYEEINHEFQKGIYRLIVAWGGSRSGKTYSILLIFALWLINNRNKTITVWRETRVVCRKTVMKDFKRILRQSPHLKAMFKENKTDSSFYCKATNSEIIFEGTDDMDKVHGSQQDISYFNEITGINEDVYLQVSQRTNDVIFADYNPSKSFWFERNKNRKDSIFIHSDYTKNSMCPIPIIKQLNGYRPILNELLSQTDLAVIRSYDKDNGKEVYNYCFNLFKKLNVDDADKMAKEVVLGWYNEKMGTANKYMYDVYCIGVKSEKPDKVYNGWSKISYDDYMALPYVEYYGLDFGTARPTAMVGVKFDGNKTFYVRPTLYKAGKNDGGIIRLVKGLADDEIINKRNLTVADSAKSTYISLLRNEGFSIVGAKKGADSVTSGIGIVQIFNIVYVEDFYFEEEYDNYSFILDRYNKATDVPIKKDDHYLDALRYIITYLYYFLGIKVK